MTRLREAATQALETLASERDAYITDHPMIADRVESGVILVHGERGHDPISEETFRILVNREFIREGGARHYWYITNAGVRVLDDLAHGVGS